MSGFTASRRLSWFGVGAMAALALVVAVAAPAVAQDRTLANLGDVSAYVPAPYHPHTTTVHWSLLSYDSSSYYGGVYAGGGAHYWH